MLRVAVLAGTSGTTRELHDQALSHELGAVWETSVSGRSEGEPLVAGRRRRTESCGLC